MLQCSRPMTFIDFAIIYLACGAPLSMHYFFAASRKPAIYFAARIVLVSLFWPIAAFLLIKGIRTQLVSGSQIGQNDLERRLDTLRLKIERSAFSDETAASVFEFRELFARYTGLAQAANAKNSAATVNELFKLSSHGQGDIATICLERKAKNRLLDHADAASDDLVKFISASSIYSDSTLLSSATSLAELLGDRQTASRLRELNSDASSPRVEISAGLSPQDAVPAMIR